MAEVQRSTTNSAETAQRFIEFVMMQAENAVLTLGLQPHPATGQTMRNLKAARMFIDQLEMLREKTRGNLSAEESRILNKMLGDLQFEYVRISGDITAYDTSAVPADDLDSLASPPEPQAPAASPAPAAKAAPAPKSAPAAASQGDPTAEDRKVRFTKSYG